MNNRPHRSPSFVRRARRAQRARQRLERRTQSPPKNDEDRAATQQIIARRPVGTSFDPLAVYYVESLTNALERETFAIWTR